jgi:hypothetical protein
MRTVRDHAGEHVALAEHLLLSLMAGPADGDLFGEEPLAAVVDQIERDKATHGHHHDEDYRWQI